jgi:hypothetical protein
MPAARTVGSALGEAPTAIGALENCASPAEGKLDRCNMQALAADFAIIRCRLLSGQSFGTGVMLHKCKTGINRIRSWWAIAALANFGSARARTAGE